MKKEGEFFFFAKSFVAHCEILLSKDASAESLRANPSTLASFK